MMAICGRGKYSLVVLGQHRYVAHLCRRKQARQVQVRFKGEGVCRLEVGYCRAIDFSDAVILFFR